MAEAPQAEPLPEGENTPRPRRRWRRRLITLALLFPVATVLLVAILVLVLPLIVTEDVVREEAVSALTETLGTPVSISRIEYSLLSGIEIFGVVIGPPPGFERNVFTADRIAVRYDLGT